jgi:DHA1 family bicyclomycin/chloramphenicol resistance-like MFS transporter
MSDTFVSERIKSPNMATLIIATSVGPLALNVFLPSLPGMARYFDVEYGVVQLALSLYLVAMALLQLALGPASDRYGRRPVLLASLLIFLTATFAAIFSPNVHVLLACRILQAFAASGIVLSRAIVRDTVNTEDAASKIGYITMGMSVTPMIAPFIGGYLDEIYGWKASFWLTFGLGLVALAVVYFDLAETNRNRSSSFGQQFRTYPELLSSPPFWGYTLTATFASGAFFAFLGGGPYVSTEMLKLTPSQYGFYFGIISIGYMLGNFISGRFSRRVGMNRMMFAGNVVATIGLATSLLLFLGGSMHPLALFGPAAFVGAGNGMTLPSANAGIVSVRPHLAGSASGLGGALTLGGGAVLAAITAALLSPQSGPYPLLIVTLLSAIAGMLTTFWIIRRAAVAGDL